MATKGVQFAKYEAKDNWDSLGTVKAIVGKGGKIGFMKRNFSNPEKNVAIVLTNKKGESTVISLHKDLSKLVRAGKVTIPNLLGFDVIESKEILEGREDFTRMVVLPTSGGVQEYSVDAVKEVAYQAEEASSFLPEELMAL